MKKLLLNSMCLLLTILTYAQTPDKKWSLGLHGGFAQYNGDLGQGFYASDQSAYGFFGISASRYLARHFDLVLHATKGEVGYIEDADPLPGTPANSGSLRAAQTSLSLLLHYNILGPEVPFRPFLFVGSGLMFFEERYTVPKSRLDYALYSCGGGFKVRLSPVVSLQFQEHFMYSNKDDVDQLSYDDNDAFLLHTGGVTFDLGKQKDSDGDKIADRKDKCSDTPPGIKVDADGCPLDRDKDGVPDYQDDCPDVAGIPSLKGCPDRDADGIIDRDDQCPDVAGTMALRGCPDKDGDGVADREDRCPDAPGTLALKGCPDSDGDGVADIDDRCPNTKRIYAVDASGCPMDKDGDGLFDEDDKCPDKAGIAAMQGCPDSDGDGVSDWEDRCPSTKGTIANRGCPEFAKEDLMKVTTIASKIFFEFDKSDLKPESKPQLDELVIILKKYEGANIYLEGHTDNVGTDAYNQDLSQRRMDAVKNYLMSKGIFESRMSAVGYGESRPIATNSTDAGRAKNRRVEMKLTYEEIKTKVITIPPPGQ